jgi:hypothetical protein
VARISEDEEGEQGTSSAGKSRGELGVVGDVGVGGSGGEVGMGDEGDAMRVGGSVEEVKTSSMSFTASVMMARRALRLVMVMSWKGETGKDMSGVCVIYCQMSRSSLFVS